MIDSEKPRFVAMLTGVADYYGKNLSGVVISIYWEGLKRFDLKAIENAAGRHISAGDAGQFMPKVADLAKLIEGSGQDSALMAWAKVMRAAKSIGTYQTVAFDDPVIHAVIADMGGWVAIGQIDEEKELPFKEREFVGKYRAYRNRNDLSYPPKLIGIFDRENMTDGHPECEVALIGNRKEAQKVLEAGRVGNWLEVTYLKDVKALPNLDS